MTDENWSAEPVHPWQEQAACASIGSGPYFEDIRSPEARKARAVCRVSCTVAGECLDLVMGLPESTDGIWAALSPDDRRRIRREMRRTG